MVRHVHLSLRLIAIELGIRRMLIVAQIAANKPPNPVKTINTTQYLKDHFYCELFGIYSYLNLFFVPHTNSYIYICKNDKASLALHQQQQIIYITMLISDRASVHYVDNFAVVRQFPVHVKRKSQLM